MSYTSFHMTSNVRRVGGVVAIAVVVLGTGGVVLADGAGDARLGCLLINMCAIEHTARPLALGARM